MFGACLLCALIMCAPQTGIAAPPGGSPAQPVMVVIRAEWCGACEAAKPAWRRLRETFGASMQWVELDVSDRKRRVAAAKQAMVMGAGVEGFFARNFYRTPSVAFFVSPATNASAVWIGESKYQRYAEKLAPLLPASNTPVGAH